MQALIIEMLVSVNWNLHMHSMQHVPPSVNSVTRQSADSVLVQQPNPPASDDGGG